MCNQKNVIMRYSNMNSPNNFFFEYYKFRENQNKILNFVSKDDQKRSFFIELLTLTVHHFEKYQYIF